jgi:hypothetical protein
MRLSDEELFRNFRKMLEMIDEIIQCLEAKL